jgi:hypothetical protein
VQGLIDEADYSGASWLPFGKVHLNGSYQLHLLLLVILEN